MMQGVHAEAPRPSRDVDAADWIAARLAPGGSVASLVPLGFPAYARILHPARRFYGMPVTWAEVAAETGRRVLRRSPRFRSKFSTVHASGWGATTSCCRARWHPPSRSVSTLTTSGRRISHPTSSGRTTERGSSRPRLTWTPPWSRAATDSSRNSWLSQVSRRCPPVPATRARGTPTDAT